MERLVACDWDGNVRELENEIRRVVALAGDRDTVALDMLSDHVRGSAPEGEVAPPVALADWNLARSVDSLKRRMILDAVRETGSKSRAAQRLGIPRQSLQKMMKRLGIETPEGDA
jgi:transcriptional regulator with PAS, ATPase and Fis domain